MITAEEDNFVDVELNIFRYQQDLEYRDSNSVICIKRILLLFVLGGLAGLGYIMWIACKKDGFIKL
jgi:hypothetical protein